MVKQLRVAHPRVNAEVAGRALNLDVLRRRASSKTTEEVTEAEGGRRTAGEPLRIVVRHFVFEEGQVELRIEGKDERTRDLVLPSMSLRNVGGERGATPAELGKTLLAGLLSHAAATVGKERALGEAERWIDEKLEGEPAAAGAAKRVLEGLLGGDEPQP